MAFIFRRQNNYQKESADSKHLGELQKRRQIFAETDIILPNSNKNIAYLFLHLLEDLVP